MQISLTEVAKRLLLDEMKAQNVRPVELARRLDIFPQEMTRILSLKHNTKIDTIEKVMQALGRNFNLIVVEKEK